MAKIEQLWKLPSGDVLLDAEVASSVLGKYYKGLMSAGIPASDIGQLLVVAAQKMGPLAVELAP